jgi:DtxR family Mn-dependent transcriptional regulator
MNSKSEENYLKSIYALTQENESGASTNAIAEMLSTKASSVTDMVKRLAEKDLVFYKRYQGVTLTKPGHKIAISIVRKHRLWEVFLVEHLNFKWDEVHDIAEQLEHIRSPELTNRLDAFLGSPQFDPHGDPIPDAEGNIYERDTKLLSELNELETGVIVGVNDSSSTFLQFLEGQKLVLGTRVHVKERFDYDHSVVVMVNGDKELTLSHQVCHNLCLKKEIE